MPGGQRRLKVGSLNVQGALKNKIHELETYFKFRKFDIVALQEVRHVDQLKADGYRYYSKVTADGNGGVGFLVALHLVPLVSRLKSQGDNQLWLKIRGTAGHKDLYICSAYMPQESAPVADRKSAWDQLQEDARSYKQRGEVLLSGDLNAKVGTSRNTAERKAVGPHASGNFSGNGELMLKLMCALGLANLSGHSRPRERGWGTRTDPFTAEMT